jgi:hypothetical protein
MRILFVGDFSNLHACMAKELRRLGHHVDVLSDRGGYMGTQADFFVRREPGKLGGVKYLFRLFNLIPTLKGYDKVFLINPNFLDLRPGKIKYFFDMLRRNNGAVYLTLAGDEYNFVRECWQGDIFRFSEYRVGNKPTEYHEMNPAHTFAWLADVNRRWSEYLYDYIDGAVSVLPEYDMAARPLLGDKLKFINLPVDLETLPYTPLDFDDTLLKGGPLRIFIGIRQGMEVQKGTAYMWGVAKELEREMPDKVTVECVRNLPLKDYLDRMRHSHLVLDQLYSYSPATNALQAMAMGRVAGSGAEPEYLASVNLSEAESPVFHLSPLIPDLKERLRTLALDPHPLIAMGADGRRLVEEHNDVRIIAPKLLEL